MSVRLYWQAVSHPSQAARKMLDLKGVDYKAVDVLPLQQRIHLRLAGFRGGTVPALKVDGRRIQGSREIARVADELWPAPPLFPSDPELRARVEEAERWGEEHLQPAARRIGRFGAVLSMDVRLWGARAANMPAASVVARASGPLVRYYARAHELDGRRGGTEEAVRADIAELPALLDRADALLADGTLALDPPNAATLQVLSSVALLDAQADLHPIIGERPAAKAARGLFPDYPKPIPSWIPADWLAPLRTPADAPAGATADAPADAPAGATG
jgi:glutathione S-transferase